MSETAKPDRDVATRVDPTDAGAGDRHSAYVGCQVGAACALGAVVLAALTQVWLGSFGYRIPVVTAMSIVALVACVAELAIVVAQFLCWRRLSHDGDIVAAATLPGESTSNLLHWFSYVVTLVAVVAFVWAMGWIAFDQPGFWLLGVGALLVIVAHSAGGIQVLRREGPPGTIRSHLARAMARSNAREDARAEAAEAEREIRK